MPSSKIPETPEAALLLLQRVVDYLPQFIFWKDRDSVFLGCNERFAKVAGLSSPSEIVGKTDFDLAWKTEEAEFFRKVDQRVMETGVAEYHIVEPQKQSDGKQAWLETNKIPLFNADGEVTGILGSFEDITDRKAEQEAAHHAKRLESVGRLAGGVAHDFNNLLGGIVGATEVLARRTEDPASQDLLREILRTAERAASLTNKLLAFSRRGNLREETFDIHEAVENVAPLLRRGLDPRIAVEFELAARRTHVQGDASEIELALLNLGLNARDAMPTGGLLRIATSNVNLTEKDCAGSPFELRPGPHVRIEVEDTGVGIPRDLVERVFEPFFTTKAGDSGTGLGLSAVYGAVQAHRGAVRVEAERQKGAHFTIDLPLTTGTPRSQTRPDMAAVPSFAGKVLLVDDEQLLLTTTGERLRGLGFEVLTAHDGEAALRQFDDHASDLVLVLMDVVMPRLGGVECCRRMLEKRPGLPVILSSGFTRDQLIGADAHTRDVLFLKKPYAHSTLVRCVTEALAAACSKGSDG